MIKDARWKKEIEILHDNYPWFTPFETATGYIGFCGYLKGPRSKRLFQVLMKIPARLYPEREPPIYIDPRPERHHWRADDVNGIPGGRLCYQRQKNGMLVQTRWNPAYNTFANVLRFAIQYLEDFDR